MSQSELRRKKENIRGSQVLQRISGKAVRPYRKDGYANVLNKYGTSHDNSEAYSYEREPIVPDTQLTSLYEGNGLFSKIIDTPAEEALKHGFSLNLNNEGLDNFVEEALDDLEWEEKAAAAIKWARLYGGSIIVMLINDGRGLEEPVDWKNIKSIDELRVFERAIVQPDYTSLYIQDCGGDGKGNRTSRFGEPEFYYVNSMFGSFTVHESRCLVFRNGVLPEQISNTTYQMWGMPEYIRIKRALRETVTAHSDAVKLLERSVQAIYSMKNLAQLLATDDGENQVVRRLEVIDMARGLLNSIAIDADGENYDFKSITFSGVKDVIDSACNMLSALTNIPQTLLFGRSPAGMNATGESDLENYYNFVERIQKLMLKKNLRYLMDIVFRAGAASGEIMEKPDYKLSFNPLWNLSETEQAAVEQQRAAAALTKAQTAQIYVDMQALDATEVRNKLASDDEFDVEDIIDEDDDIYSAIFGEETGKAESEAEAVMQNAEQHEAAGGVEQSAPKGQMIAEERKRADTAEPNTVGVLIIKDGKVLTGVRKSDFYPFTVCGPGGHIEKGETAEQAAVRETWEEFGVTPTELIPLTVRTGLAEEFGRPAYFLCTEYDGEIRCEDHSEMAAPQMSDLGEVLKAVEDNSETLFPPFADSIRVLQQLLYQEVNSCNKGDEISENGLPNNDDTAIIKSSEADDFNESDHPRDEEGKFTEGGGGNSTNSNSQPKRVSSKKGETPSEPFAKKCLSAFTGLKTSDGKSIERVHDHAMFKMESRSIRPESAVKAITKGKASSGNKPNRTVYEYNGTHVVYDDKAKMITSCIYKGKGKKGTK